ncbi:hypothetical protein HCN44_000867 [Aphidius gifuensis]|uniref:Regulatory protein zeste n=1 Tax=Aphidius gifuensis TaxID=684658 RepID=A0A834Y1U1_APHGI|nr:hypothetical protein HCN44_000867 [Aphidius gifuensis]
MANVVRSSNYEVRETMLLVDLVYKYKSIINNKETDGISNKFKDECWTKIEKEFNQGPSQNESRPISSLKNKWSNLKKEARSYSAGMKRIKYETGGGKKKLFTNDVFEKVLSIIGLSATGFNSEYDNDAEPLKKKLKQNEVIPCVNDILEDQENSIENNKDCQEIFDHLVHESKEIPLWDRWEKKSSKKLVSAPPVFYFKSCEITFIRKKRTSSAQPPINCPLSSPISTQALERIDDSGFW